MTQEIIYVVCGLIVYVATYLVVGFVVGYLWGRWACRREGVFWAYNLRKGMEIYIPRWNRFAESHKLIYNLIFVALWPIMVPVVFSVLTMVMNKMARNEYVY